jgi:hypothetical protein
MSAGPKKPAQLSVPVHKLHLIRAVAHPVRLLILEELAKGVKCAILSSPTFSS